MAELIIEKSLLYRGIDGMLTRYEILKDRADFKGNVDSIIVYREKLLYGELIWFRTKDEISINQLDIHQNCGSPIENQSDDDVVSGLMAAENACLKHWKINYS